MRKYTRYQFKAQDMAGGNQSTSSPQLAHQKLSFSMVSRERPFPPATGISKITFSAASDLDCRFDAVPALARITPSHHDVQAVTSSGQAKEDRKQTSVESQCAASTQDTPAFGRLARAQKASMEPVVPTTLYGSPRGERHRTRDPTEPATPTLLSCVGSRAHSLALCGTTMD